jgi:hypothetical protein
MADVVSLTLSKIADKATADVTAFAILILKRLAEESLKAVIDSKAVSAQDLEILEFMAANAEIHTGYVLIDKSKPE